MKRTILFLLICLTSISFIYAQNCSICSEALKQGTKDEFFKETKHSLDETVNTLYSYDYEFWENYEKSSNKSSSLDAAFKVFTLGFGSSSSSSEKRETFNKQKSTYLYSRSLAQNDYEKISQSLVSKIPYNSFIECIKNTCGNGIFVEHETTGDDIIITVRWVITQGNPNQETTLKTDPTVANATPINYNLVKGVKLKPNNSISALYKRVDPKQDAVFSYDFEHFSTAKATVKRANYQNTTLPVGSIVASTLDYSTFCSINDIPLKGDNSEITWVPADGRNVAGSIYGDRQKNVPDLRGTFLRGLNIFDPLNNPSYARPQQKDPDNRTVNDLQMQDVQPHPHPVTDNGHTHNIGLAQVGVGGSGTVAYRPAGFGTSVNLGVPAAPANITVNNNAGAETRPTNIAVYYYIKIN